MPLIPATPAGNWPQSTVQGEWFVNFNGFGSVTSDGTSITLVPQADFNNTHAALVTTNASYNTASNPLTVEARIVNNAQVNTGTPNPWEIGWLFWNYTSNVNFTYFALKTNGWELGKGDPAYPGAQNFLATGGLPATSIGVPYNIKVEQTGTLIKVYINGALVTTYNDTSNSYTNGKVGLYTEDANVSFSNISVSNGGPTFIGTVTTSSTSVVSPSPFTYSYTIANSGSTAGTTPVSFSAGSGVTLGSYSSTVAGGASVVAPTGTGNLSTNVTIPPGGSVSFTLQATPTGFGALGSVAAVGSQSVSVPLVTVTSSQLLDWASRPECGNGSGAYQRIDAKPALAYFLGGVSNGATAYQPGTIGSNETSFNSPVSRWNAATLSVSSTVPVNVSALTITYHDQLNVLQTASLPLTGLTNITSGTHQLPNAPAAAIHVASWNITLVASVNPGGNYNATLNVPASTVVAGKNNGVDVVCGNTNVTTNLTSVMSSGTTSATAGGAAVWSWVVTNTGQSTITGLTLSNPIVACEAVRTWVATGSGSFSAGTAGSGAISGSLTLTPGASMTFTGTSTLTTTCTGALVVVGTSTLPAGALGSSPAPASVSIPVIGIPVGGVTVTHVADVSATYPSGTVVWTIKLRNNNTFALSNIDITDVLGTNVVSQTWTGSGSATGMAASGSGALSGRLAFGAGGEHTFVITAKLASVTVGSTTINTFGHTNSVGVAASSSVPVLINKTVYLTVTKTAGTDEIISGNNATYNVRIKNTGSNLATAIKVADPVASNVSLQAWSAVQTGGVTGFSPTGNGSINDTLEIPAGGEIVYSVVVTPVVGFVGSICNQVDVSYPSGITDVLNNSSQSVKAFVEVRGSAIERIVEPTSLVYTYENPSDCVDAEVVVFLEQPVTICAAANNSFTVRKPIDIVVDGQSVSFVKSPPEFTLTNWSGGSGHICQSDVLTWMESFLVPAGRKLELYTGTTMTAPQGVKVNINNSITMGKGLVIVSE